MSAIGFIADQIKAPIRRVAPSETTAALSNELLALWQFSARQRFSATQGDYTVATVTLPTKLIGDICETIGNLPKGYRAVEYDADAAELARLRVMAEAITECALKFITASKGPS